MPSPIQAGEQQPGMQGAATRRRLVTSITAGVLTGLVALLLGGTLLLLQPRTWTAEVPVLVQPAPADNPDTTAAYYDILIAGQVTATYAQVLDDQRSVASALTASGLPATGPTAPSVAVTVVAGTMLLNVSATGTTADLASRAADVVAKDAVVRIRALGDPFVAEVLGTASGAARQQSRGATGIVVVALTAAGAAGLAVQQIVYRTQGGGSRRRTDDPPLPPRSPRSPGMDDEKREGTDGSSAVRAAADPESEGAPSRGRTRAERVFDPLGQ